MTRFWPKDPDRKDLREHFEGFWEVTLSDPTLKVEGILFPETARYKSLRLGHGFSDQRNPRTGIAHRVVRVIAHGTTAKDPRLLKAAVIVRDENDSLSTRPMGHGKMVVDYEDFETEDESQVWTDESFGYDEHSRYRDGSESTR